MKLPGHINTHSNFISAKLKEFLTIAGCVLSINVMAANSLSALTNKDSNLELQKVNWAGLYVGGFAGGMWGTSNFNTHAGVVTNSSYFASMANILSVNAYGSPTLDLDTFTGGMQIGNNWVLNNLLLGLALDYGSFYIHDSNNAAGIRYPTTPLSYSIETSLQTNWLFTTRGRLGFSPRTSWPMVYATGGLAVTKLKVANRFNDAPGALGVGASSSSSTKAGWTIGGGLELPLAKNFTINGEYLYVHFAPTLVAGAVLCSGNCNFSSQLNTSANLSANLIRVGLNYKI